MFDLTTINFLQGYYLAGNQVESYIVAMAVFLLSFTILKIFKHEVIGRLKKVKRKTKTIVDDIIIDFINSFGLPFYFLISLYISLHFISVPKFANTYLYYVLIIAATFYFVKGLTFIVEYWKKDVITKKKEEDKKFDPSIIDLTGKIIKGTLWFMAFIFILSNMGYNVSTLIAGLGIGGIAVAFAIQNILGDVFASFSIYFDKPFKPGDFIVIDEDRGTVEKIGIKSTRIRSLSGEEIVISNRELTNKRVHNYGRMRKRRVSFSFGVTYQTPTEKLKKIPLIVKEIIDSIELAEIERVHFKEFGDFSLNFEVVYYVNTKDYKTYMDIQQEINLALKERFEREGIEFAYPTQTIFLGK